MDLVRLVVATQDYAVPLLFGVSLLSRAGAPLPAAPLLVLMGGLVAGTSGRAIALVLASTIGGAMGDMIWYWAGQRLGRRVLSVVCKVSLSADVCVRQSETLFVRWGAFSLFAAKFVPGLGAVAPPLAGALGWRWATFARWNLAASLIWSAAYLVLGMLFQKQVTHVIDVMIDLGHYAVWLVGAFLVAYVAQRFYRRHQAAVAARMRRITVDELKAALASTKPPLLIDVRSPEGRMLDPRAIPGAVNISLKQIKEYAARLESDQTVVLYCACPNDASAVAAAAMLHGHGHQGAVPLLGGLEAWYEAEVAVEALLEDADERLANHTPPTIIPAAQ
ncbi:rhodanese-like domain-containing protein [Amantichitinum ursilacus]|uniref:Molybdopterin biosynthesis-like protein MoeZ n=1 Tax=Amantichitinum ursilacus TaxID=857265 RepID=A0A0N1JTH4_9NEIS|nr:rhodanese-like domain-containing protein [Amantichitinum ursilacus]KPC54297.1 molybdopterin biosynthesis-like protein MoeZ [Amantichitinum ursilacus]